MSQTANKFSPEVRERAVRMVLDNQGQHESRWSAILSISAKIECAPQTLNEWIKRSEIDSGKRTGIPRDLAEKMKALERESCARPTKSCAKRAPILRWRSSTAHSSDDCLHRRS